MIWCLLYCRFHIVFQQLLQERRTATTPKLRLCTKTRHFLISLKFLLCFTCLTTLFPNITIICCSFSFRLLNYYYLVLHHFYFHCNSIGSQCSVIRSFSLDSASMLPNWYKSQWPGIASWVIGSEGLIFSSDVIFPIFRMVSGFHVQI